MHSVKLANRCGTLLVLLPVVALCKDLIRISPERDASDPIAVTVVDARPEWQKKKKLLSLWRTACDFAIVRWGDAHSTPGRTDTVAYGLQQYLPPALHEHEFKLTWFTLHSNQQAPAGPDETGLVNGVLQSMECRRGAEMLGGVAKEEASPPAPLVVDIVVELDGREFSGRAVRNMPEVNQAPVAIVDEALQKLAKNIQDQSPASTPCSRLHEAMTAQPKVSFYAKSYREYCSHIQREPTAVPPSSP